MPTFNTDIYKGQVHPVVGGVITSSLSRNADSNVVSGDVQFAVIPYVIGSSGTENNADIINLCVLPAGCIPLPQLSRVTCNGSPGAGFGFKIGTAADDDGWATNILLIPTGRDFPFYNASAAQPAFTAPTPLVPDAGSGNAVVFATLSGMSGPIPGSVIYFTLAYKRAK